MFIDKTSAQSKEIVQIENKVNHLEYLYQNGSYTEVLSEASSLSKNLKNNPTLPKHYYITSKIYSLKATWSILDFDKTTLLETEVSKEIEALLNDNDRTAARLEFVHYYNLIGNFQKASEIHSKIQRNALSHDPSLELRMQMEKIPYLIGQQYFLEAKKSIATAGKILTDSSFKINWGRNISPDDLKAILKNHQLLNLIKNGNYSEAEKQFSALEKWYSYTLQKTNSEYSKFLELKADIAYTRQQYKKAYKLYLGSYTALTASDYQQHKIYLLAKVTALSSLLGDITSYNQYMRRLQLHADRNIEKYNSFQLVHSYAEAYSYFVKGDYSNSLLKLKKIISKYPSMPAHHSFRTLVYSLEETIYEEDGQVAVLGTLLDSLSNITKKYKGEKSPSYYEMILKRAKIGLRLGEHPIGLENELKEKYTQLCPSFIDSIGHIAYSYYEFMADISFQTDRFQLAKKKSDRSKYIAQRLYDSLSWEYSSVYIKNIEYTIWAGDYKTALKDYAALPLIEKYLKGIDNNFQYILFQRFALSGKLLGDFNSLKTCSSKALKLLEAESKNQRLVFSVIREQAAAAYIDVSNLFAAEKTLMQLLKLKKEKSGNADPSLLVLYKELSRLYILNGNFSQADKMLTEYLKLSKLLYGEGSIVYNEGIFQKGLYFISIGDLNRAKENFESCLKIQRILLGEQHLVVATTYIELAGINVKLNPEKFIQNEQSFLAAGVIVEATIGKNNQVYAQYLQLLAEFYSSFAKYNQATEMLLQANQYWESKLSIKNVHSADIAMLLGKISYMKSSYKESEQLYTKAKEIYGTIFNEQHPSYASATARLAKVAYMLDNKDRSIALMEICIPNYLNYVEKYFPSLSFQEKSKFWFSMKDEFEFYNFLTLSTLANSKGKLNGNVYNNIIATKALLLSSDIKLRKQINSSGDTLLIRLFEEWLTKKELLTTIFSYSKEQLAEQGLDQRSIELRLESLEKEMSERSGLFQSDSKNSILKWNDIQSSLNKNEYAVEIIRYRFFDQVFKDSIIYAALIINKETEDNPELVILPDGNRMESRYLQYYKNAVVFNLEDEYSYDVFWKPIKSKIPDNAHVFLSSDGVYNQLNIEMFYNHSNNKFVLDENQVVQLTNTKDIIAETSSKKSKSIKTEKVKGDFVLCGNPAFYVNFEKKKTVKPLPGAENEVKSLKELLDQYGKKNLTLINDQVTEDTLKSVKNPAALHIATHGYFKETEKKEAEDFSDHPLLNSGLMLTGSGNIMDGENKYVNSANGILTAYEVVNMQLDQTEIVVLSACETGKGQLQAGEGVYGLQRSFLIAGANCVILSLFKVNDEVTKEMMILFYTNWLSTNDKRQAFVNAKKTIKEKYKSPIYWGAFIMIEGKNQRKNINN